MTTSLKTNISLKGCFFMLATISCGLAFVRRQAQIAFTMEINGCYIVDEQTAFMSEAVIRPILSRCHSFDFDCCLVKTSSFLDVTVIRQNNLSHSCLSSSPSFPTYFSPLGFSSESGEWPSCKILGMKALGT